MITEKIKLIMRQRGITNLQLAEHLGILPQALSNKFSRGSYSVEDLINIMDFMGCDIVIKPRPDIEVRLGMDDIRNTK